MSGKSELFQTYAAAGVDIDAGDALVEYFKSINPQIGGFSGLFPIPRGFKRPRLVASTDGVGTKLMVAQLARRHDTIGIDLVAMVVNDLIVCGARPLFFLDYFATGRLQPKQARAVVRGIARGCEQAGCPLLGGETAEMPGMYGPGHYDLAGFGVGVVEAAGVIDGRHVAPGDLILGLESSGLHSNGYSLARRVLLPEEEPAVRRVLRRKLYRGGPTVGEALLAPTRIYVRCVLDLIKRYPVRAAAHVTGGGIGGNLVRSLNRGLRACIDLSAWQPPPIFQAIAEQGPVRPAEMRRVFNMGIGFILIVPADAAKKIQRRARHLGESCRVIGWVEPDDEGDPTPKVQFVDAGGSLAS